MSKRDGGMFHARQGIAGIRRAQQNAEQVRAFTERLTRKPRESPKPTEIVCFNPAARLLHVGDEYHIDHTGSKGTIVAIDVPRRLVTVLPSKRI